MKKVLIVVLISMLFGVVVGSFTEVKAIPSEFDLSFHTPRFTYLRDSSGNVIDYSVEYGVDVDYYEDDPILYPVVLEQIDYEGNFIKRLDYQSTEFERTDQIILATNYKTIVTTIDEPIKIDLSSEIVGEVISIESAFYESGLPMASYDWYYSPDSATLTLLPNDLTLNEELTFNIIYFQGTQFTYNYIYDWSTVLWSLDNLVYYRLLFRDDIIHSGAVMRVRPPQNIENPTTLESVEIGEFYMEGSIPDLTDQFGFTYSKQIDSFMIIFYELKTGTIYGDLGTDFNYVFTDISNNTLEYTFDVTDLLRFQLSSYDVAIDIPEVLRVGFIILDINGELNFTNTDSSLINSYLLYNDFDVGSYLLSAYDYDLSALRDVSEVIINITDNNEYPFILDNIYNNVVIGGNQVLQFKKTDTTISDNYTTTTALDPSINFEYADYINSINTTYGITYKTIDELLTITPYWKVAPNNLPYSLDVADYTITVTTSYSTVDTLNTEEQINNLILTSPFNSDLGRIFLALFIFLVVNVMLSMFKYANSNISYIVVNISLIFLFTYLDFIAIWVSLGIGSLLALMMLLIFNRSEVNEV